MSLQKLRQSAAENAHQASASTTFPVQWRSSAELFDGQEHLLASHATCAAGAAGRTAALLLVPKPLPIDEFTADDNIRGVHDMSWTDGRWESVVEGSATMLLVHVVANLYRQERGNGATHVNGEVDKGASACRHGALSNLIHRRGQNRNHQSNPISSPSSDA